MQASVYVYLACMVDAYIRNTAHLLYLLTTTTAVLAVKPNNAKTHRMKLIITGIHKRHVCIYWGQRTTIRAYNYDGKEKTTQQQLLFLKKLSCFAITTFTDLIDLLVLC